MKLTIGETVAGEKNPKVRHSLIRASVLTGMMHVVFNKSGKGLSVKLFQSSCSHFSPEEQRDARWHLGLRKKVQDETLLHLPGMRYNGT